MEPSVLRIAKALMRTSLITGMQYRSDFIFGVLTGLPRTLSILIPLLLVYSQREVVAGFGRYDAMLVLALFLLMTAFNEGFMEPNLGLVVEAIRDGSLDLVLMKPADAQLLVSVRRIDVSRVWDAVAAFVVGGWALAHMGMPTITDLSLAIVMAFCGLCAMYGLWILAISTSFFFVRVDNLRYLVNSAASAGRWPITFFSGGIRWVLTVVVPAGVVTTFPVLALRGEADWKIVGVGLLTGFGFLTLSRLAWKRALGAYSSASS